MKIFLRGAGGLPRYFVLFFVAMTLISVFGGYQLARLLNKMEQRAEKLLVIELNLDDATSALGVQIQEWKDMLLRSGNPELYEKHRQAFQDSSVGVQYAFLRTKEAMQDAGMETGVIDQLSNEHKSLIANYLVAQAKLEPGRDESTHAVDKLVIGSDRSLQQHLALVKEQTEMLVQQQLSGTMPGEERRYWLTGLLGALSLLLMSLIGFVVASCYQEHEAKEDWPTETAQSNRL